MVVLVWNPDINMYTPLPVVPNMTIPPFVFDEHYGLFFPTYAWWPRDPIRGGYALYVVSPGGWMPYDVFVRGVMHSDRSPPIFLGLPWSLVDWSGDGTNDMYPPHRRVPVLPAGGSGDDTAWYPRSADRHPCREDWCREDPPRTQQAHASNHPAALGCITLVIVIVVLGIVSGFWEIQGVARIDEPPRPVHLVASSSRVSNHTPFIRPAVGDYRLRLPPSVTADEIDRILASYQSPASGTGHLWVDAGVSYGIDPAYALAFFIHESVAGTHPQWAGRKSDGTTTHNIGNIICAGYPRCYGRFRDYGSWEEGIRDWFRLIADEYITARNIENVRDVIPIYAPAVENNVASYTQHVCDLVDRWRSGTIP
jgi:hypothetical protein